MALASFDQKASARVVRATAEVAMRVEAPSFRKFSIVSQSHID